MANAKIVQLTDQQGNELAPQTLTKQVVKQDGQLLDSLLLTKTNTTEYIPTGDYNPATKNYVDTKLKTKIVVSVQKPKDMSIGDIWYQEPGSPYIWSEVDALNYTFADVDELDMTWADADMGSW